MLFFNTQNAIQVPLPLVTPFGMGDKQSTLQQNHILIIYKTLLNMRKCVECSYGNENEAHPNSSK
jgi:hypothetical protein